MLPMVMTKLHNRPFDQGSEVFRKNGSGKLLYPFCKDRNDGYIKNQRHTSFLPNPLPLLIDSMLAPSVETANPFRSDDHKDQDQRPP